WKRNLRTCRAVIALEPRLEEYVSGKRKPKDAEEAIYLMDLCHVKGRHAEAVRFFDQMLALDPELPERQFEVRNPRRTAAQSAVRAGLREKALEWSRAELAQWKRVLDEDHEEWAGGARADFLIWQNDPDLAAVREVHLMFDLPEAEFEAWAKFWDEVDELFESLLEGK
ncbi:MAG: hypothetical protein ACYS99_08885, partial [Planctomycetota bacterium]